MGFFPNFDRECPEDQRGLPRKTGLPRFWEVLSRDFWDVFRAGFLALLGSLPFLVGMAFAITSHVLIFAPIAGLIGGALGYAAQKIKVFLKKEFAYLLGWCYDLHKAYPLVFYGWSRFHYNTFGLCLLFSSFF